MVAISAPEEQRLRLSAVPWESYVIYSDGLGPRHIRVTYDRGEMEVMTLSSRHEHKKKLLARLVEALTEEMEIDVASFGSMTYRRKDLRRGLEADESYWIHNEPIIRGREEIDLEVDPPPDLVLEIDISRSTLNRMAIYAALRVPEVWRWDGNHLRVFFLSARGTYRQNERSKAFPFLPMAEFIQFLTRRDLGETRLLRNFRAWVRKHKKRGWKERR
ncbi:MAG TPA: Uma2 family endonuclease [Gemmataceae bacterium]|jgi:Uma2 family endonuclease|nr:Uma2 family endonuclease [Gemmataceae bacterium]